MSVTTIRAPSRPRSGGRVPPAVTELALPALTVVAGLQLLRLMVTTVVSVYRDRLGAPLTSLALFAFLVVGLGFLAAPAARLLGRRRALVVSAAGVALVRLVVQLVPDAYARWLLAPLGVVLFLWFVPLWLDRDGRGFGLALLVGLAADTALAGLGGGWDYDWSTTPWTVAVAVALAVAALAALAALPDPPPGGSGGPPGWSPGGSGGSGGPPGWSPGGSGEGNRRLVDVVPLAGIGPALFPHALVWQNLGWQAVLGGRSPAQAFLLVMVGNLAALAAGTATALARAVRWPVAGTALAGLAVAVALGETATVAAGLLGQAATAVLLVVIVRRATVPAGGLGRSSPGPRSTGGLGMSPPGPPLAGEAPGRPAGLGAVAAAWTAGMGLFVLLVFAYYAAYDVVLPAGNGPLLALAAALFGLAAAGAAFAGPAPRSAPRRGSVADSDGARAALSTAPIAVGVALLLVPLLSWAAAPGPVAAAPGSGAGRPVRVMSYNLHFGFDVSGWSDLEGVARAIEATGAEVVGLQEVSRGWYVNGATDMLAWLQRRLRMPYARFAGASDAVWGNAVLSRYPIVAGEVVRLPREGVPLRRSALRVELDLGGGRRLRVVVTHLHHVEGPDGARVRLAQLPRVLALAAGRPATVVMGDFNAEPGSAEVALLREAGLADAFTAAGGGPADELTWPADRPERRIDYIWLSGDLAATGFVATSSTASDHRGIAVTVQPATARSRPSADG
jgi:endonuclease/exonuclease/phosphatase family metal-dependent hydrolase